jgi:nucleotidyltransferase substrate binding protein (TIGR01987 family)
LNISTKNPLFNDFGLTIARLEEALRLEKNGIVRDSAIKRFELCFDLAWKCIQVLAREEGVECNSPRSCLKTAFQLGFLDYDEVWMEMLEDRNQTVHIYKEAYADEVYARLPRYAGLLARLVAGFSA